MKTTSQILYSVVAATALAIFGVTVAEGNHYILPCGAACVTLGVEAAIGPPGAITTDVLGNVFFSSPNVVYKLDQRGSLTRVAGNGTAGYSGDGGPATLALLSFPQSYPEMEHDAADFGELVAGLAVDHSGNVYIADAYNDRVRRVDVRGVITSVLGPSGAGSPATWPQGLATDASGNLYISYAFGALLKRTPEGSISYLAGPLCGPGHAGAGLCAPEGIAVDTTGNVYVPDIYCRVREVATNGVIITIAGLDQVPDDSHGLAVTCGFSGDGGPATHAALSNMPYGVAVDGRGNVYIADTYNNCIRRIDATGTIRTIAGMPRSPGYSGDGGPAAIAQLNLPHGVAVDTAGNIYIADTGNNRIRKISLDGTITTVAGGGSAVAPANGMGQFDNVPGHPRTTEIQ